ncbi:motile sperm domain-containing protein 2-like isoform X2 [Sycon ciliatum]|uniref:motile sperm domain-containing protein 2-like isoform X2 n=1 Tax=Sycon ciliatum TaxID=27933 RepID=UPI0031F6251C
MCMDCMAWRRKMGVQGMTVHDLDEQLVRSGITFLHGRDREGNACLVINTRFHKKDAERFLLVKKYLVFLLEQQRIREPSNQLTVIFDMTGTGLGNVDMEFIRFIIDCFKFYFPNMLNYLLVFEMPFILSTVWKIVKGWLSERAQAKIKFVKKGDIQEYIDAEQLVTTLGGTDTFTFDADEFMQQHAPAELRHFESIAMEEADEDCNGDHADGTQAGSDSSPLPRRVHFAEDFSSCSTSQPEDRKTRPSTSRQESNDSVTSQQRQAHVHNLLQQQTSKESLNGGGSPGSSLRRRHVTTAGLLEISPSSVMEFRGNGTDDIVVPLSIRNISTNAIGFKIKTTGPDRYHVKPSAGIVQTGASAIANVTLRSGADRSLVLQDKFLVEFCPVPPTLQASELSRFLKSVEKSAMQEQKLLIQIAKPTPPASQPKTEVVATETKRDATQASTAATPAAVASQSPNLRQLQRSLTEMESRLGQLERSHQVMIGQNKTVLDLAYVFIVFCFLVALVYLAHRHQLLQYADAWL